MRRYRKAFRTLAEAKRAAPSFAPSFAPSHDLLYSSILGLAAKDGLTVREYGEEFIGEGLIVCKDEEKDLVISFMASSYSAEFSHFYRCVYNDWQKRERKMLFGKKAKRKFDELMNKYNERAHEYGDEIHDAVAGIFRDGAVCVAFDNKDLCCWTEEFNDIREAVKFCNGETAIDAHGIRVG